jgi:polyribonucleotide nucleotidyltransferase
MSFIEPKRVEAVFGGRTLILETGALARQATTSVLARYGDTVVLAALVCGDAPPPPTSPANFRDFQPLTVEYREKPFSAGKIPGGFFKREGRPTTEETLTSRNIDRPIRALFPEGFFNDIQIFASVVSAEEDVNPDVVGQNAAAACVALGGFPFKGPVATMRVGLIDGRFVANPTRPQVAQSELNMIVSANPEGICMVEAEAHEVPEDRLLQAFEFALKELQPVIEMQKRLAELVGPPPTEYKLQTFPPELLQRLDKTYGAEVEKAFFLQKKAERKALLKEIRERMLRELSLDDKGQPRPDGIPFEQVLRARAKLEEITFRRNAIVGKRADGRGLRDVRPIWIQVGALPRAHGSAIFTRGETQALVTLTLGTKEDEQWVDGIHEYDKRFMLHYNFPSFSTGEIKPIRGPGRREIGHGDLAERSLQAMIPGPDEFPYTIRIVSDILESNGSSSMASICGASLAMMDGGVQIKAPVAGIAMGLISEDDGRYAILTDILGTEDAYGDMDFKVAGTEKGITGLQMDLKTPGIKIEIVRAALEQAREGRLHILGKMREALPAPRPDISPWAPKILRIPVPIDKIGLIIGGGGRTIRGIQQRTDTEVEFDDEAGFAIIIGRDLEKVKQAASYITSIVEGLKVGEMRKAKVVELRDFGAFVEVIPTGEPGMIHVSEITSSYVENVQEYLKVGQEIDVKVISVDEMGKVRMSLKQANESLGKPPAEAVYQGAAPPPPRRDMGRGGPRRGGCGGGGRGGPGGPRRDGDRRGPGGPRRDFGGGGGGGRRF